MWLHSTSCASCLLFCVLDVSDVNIYLGRREGGGQGGRGRSSRMKEHAWGHMLQHQSMCWSSEHLQSKKKKKKKSHARKNNVRKREEMRRESNGAGEEKSTWLNKCACQQIGILPCRFQCSTCVFSMSTWWLTCLLQGMTETARTSMMLDLAHVSFTALCSWEQPGFVYTTVSPQTVGAHTLAVLPGSHSNCAHLGASWLLVKLCENFTLNVCTRHATIMAWRTYRTRYIFTYMKHHCVGLTLPLYMTLILPRVSSLSWVN